MIILIHIERQQRFEPVEITIKVETNAELIALQSFKLTDNTTTARNMQAAIHRELLNL